jgi:hypothetical protein
MNYLRFLSLACVSAEAAAVLAAFEDLGLLNTFEAADAAFFDVDSFLAIVTSFLWHKIMGLDGTQTPSIVFLK